MTERFAMNPNEGFKKWLEGWMLKGGKTENQARADFDSFPKTPPSAYVVPDPREFGPTMNDQER
jgi:hypothetical protein